MPAEHEGRSTRRGSAIVLAALLLSAACGPKPPAAVLLFDGAGTSRGDVSAFERLLDANGIAFERVDSARIESLGAAEIQARRLLIVPGGNFVEMSRALSPAARVRVQEAVANGWNYLGVCAGAFLAGSSPVGSNRLEPHFDGFDLASGMAFGFSEASARGIRKAPVWVKTADGTALEQYWEDGPALAGWGAVVGTYPDGTPAIVEGSCGAGRVLLCGVHSEAPESWREGMSFTTPASADNSYAVMLIRALLEGRPLAHW